MEAKVHAYESQLQLLLHTSKMLQGSFLPTTLCNLAMSTLRESTGGEYVRVMLDLCTGCGVPLAAQEITAMVKMSCKHSYHLLCFATACSLWTKCSASNCQQRLPKDYCSELTGQGHATTPFSGKIICHFMLTSTLCMLTSNLCMLTSTLYMLTSIHRVPQYAN